MSEAPPPGSQAPSAVPCVHCGAHHPASYSHCPQTGKALGAGRALLGRVIAERYRITGLLGEGGMGAVYLAEHVLIGRPVALKRLHPELAAEHSAVVRFQREARAAAAIGHDHIVDILDLGFAEDGAPFLVMERLEGESLAQRLQRTGRLAPTAACAIVGQTLDALRAVHRKGMVHRDLKPDNIFLTARSGRADFVKVLDFGVSKMRRDETDDLQLTRTGVMLGTPYYMSPEQARGDRAVDPAVDLWASAVILYQALAGRLPFHGDNYHALLQAILGSDPPRLDGIAPEVPRPLAELVHNALSRDRGARPADAQALLRALGPFGASDPETTPLASGVRPSHPPAAAPPAASLPTPRTPLSAAPPPPGQPTPPRPSTSPPRGWTPGSGAHPREARLTPREAADVKGALVLGALEHIRTTRGRATVDDVVAALPESSRSAIEGVLLPVTWLPLGHYVRLLQEADRRLGSGSGSVAEAIGAATAEDELANTHRLFVRTATPLRAVERLPRLWSSYHGAGRLELAADGDAWNIEVHDLVPDELVHAKAMSGFYRCLLELSGGRDVRVSVLSCRGEGDERTVTRVQWR